VISPWTYQRGICSDPYDHTSILKFLEEVTNVPCPNISTWRRNTFKSLSSLEQNGFTLPSPTVNVPARPDVGTLQSNAISRYNNAPNKQNDNPQSWWQNNLGPSSYVPNPQTWPPVPQGCQLIMTMPSYGQGQVLDQANGGDTATFPNAFMVVVSGFEPMELTTPYALCKRGSAEAKSPPTPSCSTRIPKIKIADGNNNPVTTIVPACTYVDFDPNQTTTQTGGALYFHLLLFADFQRHQRPS
jgi:hypothetical protein